MDQVSFGRVILCLWSLCWSYVAASDQIEIVIAELFIQPEYQIDCYAYYDIFGNTAGIVFFSLIVYFWVLCGPCEFVSIVLTAILTPILIIAYWPLGLIIVGAVEVVESYLFFLIAGTICTLLWCCCEIGCLPVITPVLLLNAIVAACWLVPIALFLVFMLVFSIKYECHKSVVLTNGTIIPIS